MFIPKKEIELTIMMRGNYMRLEYLYLSSRHERANVLNDPTLAKIGWNIYAEIDYDKYR